MASRNALSLTSWGSLRNPITFRRNRLNVISSSNDPPGRLGTRPLVLIEFRTAVTRVALPHAVSEFQRMEQSGTDIDNIDCAGRRLGGRLCRIGIRVKCARARCRHPAAREQTAWSKRVRLSGPAAQSRRRLVRLRDSGVPRLRQTPDRVGPGRRHARQCPGIHPADPVGARATSLAGDARISFLAR
jgi:hypothetical protein